MGKRKRLADAWLLASGRAAERTLVTFDHALVKRGAHCLLLHSGKDAQFVKTSADY